MSVPILPEQPNSIIDLFSGVGLESHEEPMYLRRRRDSNSPLDLKETLWDASLSPGDDSPRHKRRILRGGLSKRRHTNIRSATKRETPRQEQVSPSLPARNARKCNRRSVENESSNKKREDFTISENLPKLTPLTSLAEEYYDYEEGPAGTSRDTSAYSKEIEGLADVDNREKRGGKQTEGEEQFKRNSGAPENGIFKEKLTPVKRDNIKAKSSFTSGDTPKVNRASNEKKRETQQTPAQEEGKVDYYDDNEYDGQYFEEKDLHLQKGKK